MAGTSGTLSSEWHGTLCHRMMTDCLWLSLMGVTIWRHLQNTAARCTYKGTNSHVDISWASLVAVETSLIMSHSHDFSQHFEMFLILLSLVGCHLECGLCFGCFRICLSLCSSFCLVLGWNVLINFYRQGTSSNRWRTMINLVSQVSYHMLSFRVAVSILITNIVWSVDLHDSGLAGLMGNGD